MIKLCKPIEESGSQSLEDLNNRVLKLEKQVSEGNFVTPKNTVQNTEKAPKEEKKKNQTEKIDLKKLNISKLEFWPKVINNLKEQRKMLLATNLLNTTATLINDMTVGIVFENGLTPFIKSIMERPENMQELTKLISIECGKEMRVKLLDNQDAILQQKAKEEKNPIDDLDIPINVIDE